MILIFVHYKLGFKQGRLRDANYKRDNSASDRNRMNKSIEEYIQSLSGDVKDLPDSRISILKEIISYLKESTNPRLHFICTHNSRRSHLSQVWAQTLSTFFHQRITTFSGGTEATAFHPNGVEALRRAGFEVVKGNGNNPKYQLSFSADAAPIVCWSKTFDAHPNPTKGFAAIMTCSEADTECPIVPGADRRIKLFYEDPKISDGTEREANTYDERCRQIATELYYVFHNLAHGD